MDKRFCREGRGERIGLFDVQFVYRLENIVCLFGALDQRVRVVAEKCDNDGKIQPWRSLI